MTDQTTNQSRDGPLLSAQGIAAARQIAEWCEAEFDATVRTAKLQLIYIWVLVVVGMITLLFLPVVVEWIDTKLLEEKLPKEVVDEANNAVSLLDANYQKLLEEAEKLQTARDALEAEYEGEQAARLELEEQLKAEISAPFAIWQPGKMLVEDPTIDWNRFSPRRAIRTLDDQYFIVGRWNGQEALLLYSSDARNWEKAILDIEPPKLTRDPNQIIQVVEIIDAIAESSSDGMMAVGRSRGREDVTIFLQSEDGEVWRPVASEQFGLFNARRVEVAAHPEGGFVVGGYVSGGKQNLPIVELMSRKEADVWEVKSLDLDKQAEGLTTALTVSPDGTIVVAVSQFGPELESVRIFEGDLLGNWRPTATLMEGEEATIQEFVQTPEGLIAGGYFVGPEGEVAKLFRRAPEGGWQDLLPDQQIAGFLESFLVRADGTIMVVSDLGIYEIGADKSVLLHPQDTSRVRDVISTAEDEVMLINSRVAPLTPLSPEQLVAFRSEALKGNVAEGFVSSSRIQEDIGTLSTRNAVLADLEKRRREQQSFLDSARQLERDQSAAIARVSTANEALEDALRTAEPVRQAISMGTRVAIIALLIFLVQIVVNRYRYLQRLAGFYRARGHAFRMVAAGEPDTPMPMLKDVNLTDLMSSLSPDAIGFDKAADPPTHHVSSLLQTALKR